jgi:Bax protein
MNKLHIKAFLKEYPLVFAILVCCLIYSVIWFVADWRRETIPDFASYSNTEERKAAFNAFMLPLIANAHQKILAEREQLNQIAENWENKILPESESLKNLENLAKRYYANSLFQKEQWMELFALLDKRIYPIAHSLTMAQAAIESGWGTSWLAQNGNNLFGMRCFTPGCGMQSRWGCSRADFSYSRYASPQASVDAYMLNLNRHNAYKSLREKRHSDLKNGNLPDSRELMGELRNYAEEGDDYIRMLRRMLHDNSEWLEWDHILPF